MEFYFELVRIILIIVCITISLLCLFAIFISDSRNNSTNNGGKKIVPPSFSEYTKSLLTNDEKVLNVANVKKSPVLSFCLILYIILSIIQLFFIDDMSQKKLWHYFYWNILIPIAFFVILSFIPDLYHQEMLVTNKRVFLKYGLFGANMTEINLNKIEGCDIRRGLLALLFGYATIVVKETGFTTVRIYCVSDFMKIKLSINQAIEDNRK